jgi:hypothetical protein
MYTQIGRKENKLNKCNNNPIRQREREMPIQTGEKSLIEKGKR